MLSSRSLVNTQLVALFLPRLVSLSWCVERQRELTMTGATTMAPPVAMDKQVMALFGHVLTPMAGEKALGSKLGGPPQEMEVDSSRKRPRQTRQSPPKGRGKGRGKPKDKKEEEAYSDTSERDLVLALGRIVLQQADQLHRLELDTGFFLVLATAPAAGTVIPTMFEVAELWRKKQMETPEQITCSLGVMMMRCLLQELSNRLSHALKTPEVVAALIKQEMLTDKQDWLYMLWDKDNGKLMPDPTRNPLSTKDLQQTLQDAASMLQHHPEVITRFCSTQRLDASTQNAQVPFLIDVSLRDGRMFQILHQWSRLSVWHLLHGRLRPARAKRNPAELRVQNMIRALS